MHKPYTFSAMKNMKLDSSDRDFFHLIFRAAFSNPFSEERDELDRDITGEREGTAPGVLEKISHELDQRVRKLEKANQASIKPFSGKDRELSSTAFLFQAFHLHTENFDKLIRDQIAGGDISCRVPFAGEVISLIMSRGFGEEDARRYFAFFFQLRRAFYFIRESLAGSCPCIRRLREKLWNNVFTSNMRWYESLLWNRMEDFSTLLLGETGTGKGASAISIGRSGYIPFDGKAQRFKESFMKTFISLNLSQFPETLIESELFGHRKGAFTGAIDRHEGILSRCSPYGAIFLDEIGEISIPVQIKLLQVLQERSFTPVGSHGRLRFEGRVIAATNQSIDELREKKLFREDFYYRLCSDVIVVPPLRQRIAENSQELDTLLDHTLLRMTGSHSPELREFVGSAIRKNVPADYTWPGNVRELEQCVRRVLLTGAYSAELASHGDDLRASIICGIQGHSYDADGLLADYCTFLYSSFGSYEDVARRLKLDRRTVKKYILSRQTARKP
jgi:hypothetical protein